MVSILPHPERRGVYQLKTELWLPRPIEEVFEFFSDAYNLEELTPPFLHFHVVTPSPIPMFGGQTIDYKLKLHGLPMTWRSEISLWDPPYRFVDQQLKGPYLLWHHLHTFKSQNGGTLCGDLVDYKPPFGAMANWLMVKRELTTIFQYRHQKMLELFGTPRPDSVSSGQPNPLELSPRVVPQVVGSVT
jgi:ligand-binding SRPBCC domain-containing protein